MFVKHLPKGSLRWGCEPLGSKGLEGFAVLTCLNGPLGSSSIGGARGIQAGVRGGRAARAVVGGCTEILPQAKGVALPPTADPGANDLGSLPPERVG